jgi:BMFP domain-containing protein YqiC
MGRWSGPCVREEFDAVKALAANARSEAEALGLEALLGAKAAPAAKSAPKAKAAPKKPAAKK